MNRNITRVSGKIPRPRIRIIRSWRGYPVGAVIQPPGGLRQILLEAKDQLGNKVAEMVEETPDPVVEPQEAPVVEAEVEAKPKRSSKKKGDQ